MYVVVHSVSINLKVPSHQIRLGLKGDGWIGLGEYKELQMVKMFLNVASIF